MIYNESQSLEVVWVCSVYASTVSALRKLGDGAVKLEACVRRRTRFDSSPGVEWVNSRTTRSRDD